jgi:hypothetical protein
MDRGSCAYPPWACATSGMDGEYEYPSPLDKETTTRPSELMRASVTAGAAVGCHLGVQWTVDHVHILRGHVLRLECEAPVFSSPTSSEMRCHVNMDGEYEYPSPLDKETTTRPSELMRASVTACKPRIRKIPRMPRQLLQPASFLGWSETPRMRPSWMGNTSIPRR